MFTLDFPCLSGALDDKVFFQNETIQITKDVDTITAASGAMATLSSPLPLCTLKHEESTMSESDWNLVGIDAKIPGGKFDSEVMKQQK